MKKLIAGIMLVSAMALAITPSTGLYGDKGSSAVGIGYQTGSNGYFGAAYEYCLQKNLDVYGGAGFPSGYMPISLGADYYFQKGTEGDPVALWINPDYTFYTQKISGTNVNLSAITLSGFAGYRTIANNIEFLPYVGYLWQSATATAGSATATATGTALILGAKANLPMSADKKIIGAIEITLWNGSSTTVIQATYPL